MHRALEIAELVHIVCVNVAHGAQLPRKNQRDLNSLARVSRRFGEPALDLLWESQDGIINVLKTMAEDLWEVTDSDKKRSVVGSHEL